MTWSPNPEANIAGYTVYRATSETGFKKILSYTLINDTTFTDTTIEAGQTYYYWVQAYNTDGYSSELSGVSMVDTSQTTPTGPITLDLSTYSAVIYVDDVTGDDTSGDGSIAMPYKTVPKACASIVMSNTAVYIKGAGTYLISDGLQSLLKANLEVDYIVDPAVRGQVIFNVGRVCANGGIEMTAFNRFIGVVFIRSNTASDVRIYEYFLDASIPQVSFHNCLFKQSIEDSQTMPTHYPIFVRNSNPDVAPDKSVYYYNCSFEPLFAYTDDANRCSMGIYVNCAHHTVDFTTDEYNGSGVEFDSQYHIVTDNWQNIGIGTNPDGTQAHLGIYGGAYAWGY